MKLALIAAAAVMLGMVPAMTGETLTKTGPMTPQTQVECHGGGGGPAMENQPIREFC